MWSEMADNLYRQRSAKERLRYENDEPIIHDEYTRNIIDDREIYDTENAEFESTISGWYIDNIFEE